MDVISVINNSVYLKDCIFEENSGLVSNINFKSLDYRRNLFKNRIKRILDNLFSDVELYLNSIVNEIMKNL
jgi:hypothetical protein